ncbi:hypothetical protein niasHS_005648 [Heterodera schachtii]|uniref:Ribosomal protein L32 n=1 Tax=Heterodera schachtii TaxID=97005 RepID=A0ABD2JZT0_HETSC
MFFTRILAGVPKYRTSKPRVLFRRFNRPFYQYTMRPLVQCPRCSASHEPWVLCMDCYRVLRDATEPIKRRMVSHNAYIGQRQQAMPRWTDENCINANP